MPYPRKLWFVYLRTNCTDARGCFFGLDPADKIKNFSADEFSGIQLGHLSFMSSDVLENIDGTQIAKLDSSILSEIDVTIFSSFPQCLNWFYLYAT